MLPQRINLERQLADALTLYTARMRPIECNYRGFYLFFSHQIRDAIRLKLLAVKN